MLCWVGYMTFLTNGMEMDLDDKVSFNIEVQKDKVH